MSHAFTAPATSGGVAAALQRVVLAGACAAAAAVAHAQLPAWQGAGPTRYVCGGIGSDESGAMRAAMKDHPLSLLFARADGAYLANVDVAIKGGGTGSSAAMAFRATGPVCLVDIPEGRYTIDVTTSDGQSKSQAITVGGGAKTASFRF